jgi:hypothetical protein
VRTPIRDRNLRLFKNEEGTFGLINIIIILGAGCSSNSLTLTEIPTSIPSIKTSTSSPTKPPTVTSTITASPSATPAFPTATVFTSPTNMPLLDI